MPNLFPAHIDVSKCAWRVRMTTKLCERVSYLQLLYLGVLATSVVLSRTDDLASVCKTYEKLVNTLSYVNYVMDKLCIRRSTLRYAGIRHNTTSSLKKNVVHAQNFWRMRDVLLIRFAYADCTLLLYVKCSLKQVHARYLYVTRESRYPLFVRYSFGDTRRNNV